MRGAAGHSYVRERRREQGLAGHAIDCTHHWSTVRDTDSSNRPATTDVQWVDLRR